MYIYIYIYICVDIYIRNRGCRGALIARVGPLSRHGLAAPPLKPAAGPTVICSTTVTSRNTMLQMSVF